MEGRLEPLSKNQLDRVMIYGLIVSSISIIFSVQFFYDNALWIQLTISGIVFAVIVLLIRRFNNGTK
jgi:hypothetical protein